MSDTVGRRRRSEIRREISTLATGIAGEALWPSLLEAINKFWRRRNLTII
jgi:hypothetical protein